MSVSVYEDEDEDEDVVGRKNSWSLTSNTSEMTSAPEKGGDLLRVVDLVACLVQFLSLSFKFAALVYSVAFYNREILELASVGDVGVVTCKL